MLESHKELEKFILEAIQHSDHRKGCTVPQIVKYIKRNLISEQSLVKKVYLATAYKVIIDSW